MEADRLLDSLRRAVTREPGDPVLRAHLAGLLIDAGHGQEAVGHVGQLLAEDPADRDLQALMSRALGTPGPLSASAGAEQPTDSAAAPAGAVQPAGVGAPGAQGRGFDWGAAEDDLVGGLAHEPVETSLRLADVGGLDSAKATIEAAFLTPLRHPELRERYAATLRGGMLLYGPPGCGKTHLARAVAGELGARFITVGLADVLSRWMGQSEANIAELFRYARAQAPVVLFFDEVDALGRSRSGLGRSASALRGVINQLLAELDGVASANEGLFVLGATNAPWDVDVALRRPGRFDRAVFVEPPDLAARTQIVTAALRDLPVAGGVDPGAVAARAEGFSGADLVHVCRSAAQGALVAAATTGDTDRLVTAADLAAAIADTTPSTARWFAAARNVVLFADAAGEYRDLAAHMRAHRLL
ncbi:MAG: AAA family ATPase [Candidatus Nanopelagicales bacterium]